LFSHFKENIYSEDTEPLYAFISLKFKQALTRMLQGNISSFYLITEMLRQTVFLLRPIAKTGWKEKKMSRCENIPVFAATDAFGQVPVCFMYAGTTNFGLGE
jgi:hypothetical protein